MNVAEIDRRTAVLARLEAVARGCRSTDVQCSSIQRRRPSRGTLTARPTLITGISPERSNAYVRVRPSRSATATSRTVSSIDIGAGKYVPLACVRAPNSVAGAAMGSGAAEWPQTEYAHPGDLPNVAGTGGVSTGKLSCRDMVTDDSIERHPALLQREESSWARGAQLLDLRAPASRTATGSAACSEHARFLLTDCLHFRGANVARLRRHWIRLVRLS